MHDVLKSETIFFTPSGEVVVPGEDIPIPPGVLATRESNLAPKWLIFPDRIVNTDHITNMWTNDQKLIIGLRTGETCKIEVKNMEVTWKTLQDVFSKGL